MSDESIQEFADRVYFEGGEPNERPFREYISLEEALKLLCDGWAVMVNDNAVAFASIFPDEEVFLKLEYRDRDGYNWGHTFTKANNFQVTLGPVSLLLKDIDGDDVEIAILEKKKLK